MKKIFTAVTILLLAYTIPRAQSGTFDFTTNVSSPDGPAPSQTVSGVMLTVTASNNDARVVSGENGWGTSGNVCYTTGVATSMTLTFSQKVHILSLRAGEFATTENHTWIFTPYDGATSGTSHQQTIDRNSGTTVNFPSANFGNIDKIVITLLSGSIQFVIDNVVMEAPTPVELTSFTGAAYGNIVALDWATATEINNYGFEVERRPIPNPSQREGDSKTPLWGEWGAVGFVQGHGNSNSPKSYSFQDTNPPVGKIQYRLKQIDFDGKFEYSPIVEVNVEAPAQLKLSQNYPNPFNPETKINYQIPFASRVTLKVYDVLGREVATLVDEFKQAGSYNLTFNVRHLERSRELPSGIYFYRMTNNTGFSETKKIILMK
jgi:hypothetical protein